MAPHLPGSSRLFQLAASITKRSPPGTDNSDSGSSSGSSAATSTAARPSTSCASNDNSPQCQKPTDASSATLPIVLGIVIPIVIAIAIFVFLHRRHVRKLRTEDANDKHASLDFGMERSGARVGPKAGKKNKGMQEIKIVDEKSLHRNRGMSMDMTAMGSPYLLPPGLHSSRESLHSLSRTMPSGDDRYRPCTTFIPNENGFQTRPYPPSPRKFPETSSTHTGSSGGAHDRMDSELLRNASRMSRSSPPSQKSLLTTDTGATVPSLPKPSPAFDIARKGLPSTPRPTGLAPPTQDIPRDSYIDKDGGDMRRSNNYLGAFIDHSEPDRAYTDRPLPEAPTAKQLPGLQQTESRKSPPPAIATESPMASPPRPERLDSVMPPTIVMPDAGDYMDDSHAYGDYSNHSRSFSDGSLKPLPVPPQDHSPEDSYMPTEDYLPTTDYPSTADYPPTQEYLGHGGDAPAPGYDVRRLSMGLRPLPPEDPSDDPEQRANRIRSFYKEYFDDSKPGPFPQDGGTYYEDYSQEYLGDAAYFDPDTGNFVMPGAPYADPVTRRAMTPPPRAPPRFRGPPRSHGSSMSGLMPPGPRAYSSASGRMAAMGPGGRGRPGPRKPLPPPSPLRFLPTPHMLSEDSFALPIDFAPPTTYKDRAAGRPASPRGGLMPYQPVRPAHLPLASAFDDLAVMPSP